MSLTPEAVDNLDPELNAGVAEYGDSDPVPASEQPAPDGSAQSLTTEQQFLTAPRPTAAKYEKGPTFAQCAGGKADPKWGRVISRRQHCFRTRMRLQNTDKKLAGDFELVSAWSGSAGTRNFKTVTGFRNYRYNGVDAADVDSRIRITCGSCNHQQTGWGPWTNMTTWLEDTVTVYPRLKYGRASDGMRTDMVTIEVQARFRPTGQAAWNGYAAPRQRVRCDSADYTLRQAGCIVNPAVPRLNLRTGDARTAESVAFLNRARLRPDDTYPRKAEGRKVLVGFDSATSPKPLHRLYPTAGRKATRIAKNGCVQEGGFKTGDHCDEYPFAATRENALAAKDTKN
jgi:hypothetical protein